MHITRVGLAVLLLLAFVSVAEAQSSPKFAFIDSEAILNQDPAARQAQLQFEQDMARYRAEVQQLGEELQNLIGQYDQQQAMLSEAARANRQEQIRQKQNQYQQRIQELEQQATIRQAELVEPIMERINRVIDEIRLEGSYAIIFDVAAGGIISADPSLDLTGEVVRRLQPAGQANPTGGRSR